MRSLACPRPVSLYPDIVSEFIAEGAESMQVTMEGRKPATLQFGQPRALKGKEGEGTKLTQRAE